MDWEEIKEMAEQFLEKGIDNLVRDGKVVPTYFMVTEGGVSVIPIEKHFTCDRSKRAAALAIRKIALEQSAKAVLLITEAWYALKAAPEGVPTQSILPVEMPAGHPDCVETLAINLGLPDGRGNLLLAKIVRDAAGNPTSVEERAWTLAEPRQDLPVQVVLPWEEIAGGTIH